MIVAFKWIFLWFIMICFVWTTITGLYIAVWQTCIERYSVKEKEYAILAIVWAVLLGIIVIALCHLK